MMGSVTTGVVAIKLNRKFIGIELDKCSFEIGKGRINDNCGGKPSQTEDK
jgi:DNA modification methylase